MINKITLNKVASYIDPTALETDKKVNLIYGLNGTGKSTFSNYLSQPTDEKFKNCSIDGLDDNHEILVYNQTFIQDNFYEAENLKGIFTLSKQNKEAETKITISLKEIAKLLNEKETKTKELEAESITINQKTNTAKDTIWKIKTDYSGGDRVLEFCLEGYKSSKEILFNQISGLAKPSAKPIKSIDDLKNALQSISGDNAQKTPTIPQINFPSQSIETEALFSKLIVGNENSTVSQLIREMQNSDWVNEGMQYLPKVEIQENATCPFCQKKTISNDLVQSIKSYFDASYEADIDTLKYFLDNYSQSIQNIPTKSVFESNPKYDIYKKDFEIKHSKLIKVVKDNKKLIEDKIKTPSVAVILESSTKQLDEVNDVILKINLLVAEHNKNIDQVDIVKTTIKEEFWELMRWDYDQTINSIKVDKMSSKHKVDTLEKSIKDINLKIAYQNTIISDQQKQTVNIERAITNINNGLCELGITDFEIKKHSDNFYKIVRGEHQERVFRSLSEGEKMIISFLYFIEMCRGKKEVTEIEKKKVIVIDDPISSLSHIYVFNIGRLIHNEFLRSKNYEQIFLLTHSLYFFYEMTDTKPERRKENQKLFRLIKSQAGSEISEMSYEEIQNDYHSYWFIVKNDKQPAVLIANCMRNIIEYFFNFVEKKDLNNVFQKQEMQDNRFQAFNRYVNRESHSLGQNIFDIKEFNYQDFKDAFAELFKATGYEDHYLKMIE